MVKSLTSRVVPGRFLQCDALAARARHALEAAQRLWAEVVSPFHTRMSALARDLQHEEGLTTVAEALLLLLACGSASPMVQSFFSRELREADLTRIVKALGVSANALIQL